MQRRKGINDYSSFSSLIYEFQSILKDEKLLQITDTLGFSFDVIDVYRNENQEWEFLDKDGNEHYLSFYSISDFRVFKNLKIPYNWQSVVNARRKGNHKISVEIDGKHIPFYSSDKNEEFVELTYTYDSKDYPPFQQ